MDVNDIRLKWRAGNQNKEANINMWDTKADHFGQYNIPTFEDDEFLKLLEKEKLIEKEFDILDVGCGGGKYSISISSKCKSVIGIDLSPKMIEYANMNKDKFKVNNVSFYCEDWHELDIENSSFYKKFDFVFASMTPAIQSANTFEKLSQASKGFCLIRFNTKRSDSVSDELHKILNISHKTQNLGFMYAFDMLWLQGYTPKVHYENKNWVSHEPLDKAIDIYTKGIKAHRNINEEEEEKIRKYLISISEDNYVTEEIKGTVATLYWNVKECK